MTDGPTLLVVDDDTYLRMVVQLEFAGAHVLEASRMDEAYDLARTKRPDAALIDLRLPDGDGMELVRRIRRTPSIAQIPVFVITAGHDEARRAEMLRAGADEYLAKPLDDVDVSDRLQRVLDLDPKERRVRRRTLLELNENGHVGDPAPPAEHIGAPLLQGEPAEPEKRRFLRRRRR